MPSSFPPADATFVAIDFETADPGPDSACAVGLVRVEAGVVTRREKVLIRPPRPRILYTRVHGISWPMVKDAPRFAEAWPPLADIAAGAAFFAAHNAGFDRRVLLACCDAAGLPAPGLPFVCTVQLARRRWRERGNSLPAVCGRLGIPLCHHDPLSDAEACARIVVAAVAPAAAQLRLF